MLETMTSDDIVQHLFLFLDLCFKEFMAFHTPINSFSDVFVVNRCSEIEKLRCGLDILLVSVLKNMYFYIKGKNVFTKSPHLTHILKNYFNFFLKLR